MRKRDTGRGIGWEEEAREAKVRVWGVKYDQNTICKCMKMS